MNRNIYSESVVKQLPRLLGQINGNIGSNTYGCCDRQYWHYNVVAHPAARYQEAVLTLAFLHQESASRYHGNQRILDLINACLDFWLKIQEGNGSFNEWYPHEGSYVATAFSSYAVSETILLLGRDKVTNYDALVKALSRAANWLKVRSERRVGNQQTGALLALYNVYLLTRDEALKAAVDKYEDLIVGSQKPEGWFMEYGGADIGYLSLAIDYLAKYHQKTGSKKIEKVILKAIDFISNFIHRDGTSGGVYGSRNTEYLIPHGFELFAKVSPAARFVASNIRNSLAEGRGVSLSSLDDRYLMYIGYTFLQAGWDGSEELGAAEIARPANLYLPESGLYIHRTGKLEVVANLKKLGAFICSTGGKRISDSGILIESKSKLFSGYLSDQVTVIRADDKGFTVEGSFKKLKERTLTPVSSILLQLFQLTLGRAPLLNELIKSKLRDWLIQRQKNSSVLLRRTLTIDNHRVQIKDEIEGLDSFERIIVGPKVTYIYVPSSRLYEMENINDEFQLVLTPKDLKVKDRKCLIVREY
jgi:hypothetical protein